MRDIFHMLFGKDLITFIRNIGLFGVYGIIFAESGLLLGFFLPGDSLLFTAGLLASPAFSVFNIWTLVLGCWAAAIIGDNVGYEFGKRVGKKLFHREKSLLFNPDNVIKAQEFYEKYGGKAIVLARFMPIVRTFAPIVAGIGKMDKKKFMFFNALGGTVWVWGVTWIGYFLGDMIPGVDKYLLPIVALIVLASVAPPVYHIYKENKKTLWQKLGERIKKLIKYKV